MALPSDCSEITIALETLPEPAAIPTPEPVTAAWERTAPTDAATRYDGVPVTDYHAAGHTLHVFRAPDSYTSPGTDPGVEKPDCVYGIAWEHNTEWLAGYLCRPHALEPALGTLTYGIVASAYADVTLETIAKAVADHDGVSQIENKAQVQSPSTILEELEDTVPKSASRLFD